MLRADRRARLLDHTGAVASAGWSNLRVDPTQRRSVVGVERAQLECGARRRGRQPLLQAWQDRHGSPEFVQSRFLCEEDDGVADFVYAAIDLTLDLVERCAEAGRSLQSGEDQVDSRIDRSG